MFPLTSNKANEIPPFTCAIRTKNGDQLEVSVTFIPLEVAGKLTGIYGISKDIISAVRLEKTALTGHHL